MARHSTIWKRSSNGQYHTTFKGIRYCLGSDLALAKIKFAEITGKKDERELVVDKLLAAAKLLTDNLKRKDAVSLLDAMYGMKCCSMSIDTEQGTTE